MDLEERNTARTLPRLRFWVMPIFFTGLAAIAIGCRTGQEPVRRDTRSFQAPAAVQNAALNAQAPDRQQATNQQSDDKSAQERNTQFAAGCADLLKLATDLKAQVDKTTKNVLSVGAIRKAGEIEKLAGKLREQMKPAKPAAGTKPAAGNR